MWDCSCGCRAIARDLAFCPVCFTNREEAEMPKATVGGGGSSAYGPPEGAERIPADQLPVDVSDDEAILRAQREQERDQRSDETAPAPEASSKQGTASQPPGNDAGRASDSVQVDRRASQKDTRE